MYHSQKLVSVFELFSVLSSSLFLVIFLFESFLSISVLFWDFKSRKCEEKGKTGIKCDIEPSSHQTDVKLNTEHSFAYFIYVSEINLDFFEIMLWTKKYIHISYHHRSAKHHTPLHISCISEINLEMFKATLHWPTIS